MSTKQSAVVRKPRTISKKAATSHVHKNLIRYPKQQGGEPWQGHSLETLWAFTEDVKSWLGDRSNLSTATLLAADYEELLAFFRESSGWESRKAKEEKRRALREKKEREAAEADAEKVVAKLPRQRSRSRATAVKTVIAATVAPVKITAPLHTPTATLLRKAKEEISEEIPTKVNRVVPANWRYMAEHADTESARAWWTQWCAKRMRGEV